MTPETSLAGDIPISAWPSHDKLYTAVERRPIDDLLRQCVRDFELLHHFAHMCAARRLSGVAWTTDRAASMASRNLSFVEISGFGAPSFSKTTLSTDYAERRAVLIAPNLPSLA